ncbi:MAG TPA: twin-arginine translocase subunit TatC, partial [Candidatus Desulfovibrio intestinipullorum]|nr:twin-arginine translocase subunit TatC [Candidatus Desulfovibrio intestinipullorum]
VSFATEDIVAMPKISDYLDFVLKLVLAFGFIFEMPIFSFFLSRMGIVTARKMREVRRYAVLVIFIVAAILTPPDVVSQLLMAVPMLILYEVSIIVALIFGKKEEEKPQEEEDADDEDYDEDYADEDYADEPVKRQETATAPARQDSTASAAPASTPSGTPSAAPAARPAASATAQEQVPGTGTAGQDGEQAPAQKS